MQRIVFASSGDMKERIVAEAAVAIAMQAKAELVVVQAVVDKCETTPFSLAEVQELARSWGGEVQSRAVAHRCCEDVGDTLLDIIGQLQPDLVVAGTHQRRGLAALVRGSVAESVARNLDIPSLILPLEGYPLVDSKNGTLLLDRVIVAAGDIEAIKAGLRALNTLMQAIGRSTKAVLARVETNGTKEFSLDTIDAGLRSNQWIQSEWLQLRGDDVAEELSRFVRSSHASMVIMATRGHDQLADALRGSTTERVLRSIDRPLLVVPIQGS
ncbi:MAG: universal stress protein [Sandaracinaceae bacterium]|nr:universal stress protein [Sandaracinaceae bacterium]